MKLYDIHQHSRYSACGNPSSNITDIARIAAARNLDFIGVSDHAWSSFVDGASGWYKNQTFERLRSQTTESQTAQELYGITIFLGAEAEFCMNKFSFVEQDAVRLDYLLCAHSHVHQKGFVLPVSMDSPRGIAKYMLESIEALCQNPLSRHLTGIVHPMYPCGKHISECDEIYAFISDSELEYVCGLAKSKNIALELNASLFSRISDEQFVNSGYARLFHAAKRCGSDLFYGSDKHMFINADTPDYFYRVPKISHMLGLEQSDFETVRQQFLSRDIYRL